VSPNEPQTTITEATGPPPLDSQTKTALGTMKTCARYCKEAERAIAAAEQAIQVLTTLQTQGIALLSEALRASQNMCTEASIHETLVEQYDRLPTLKDKAILASLRAQCIAARKASCKLERRLKHVQANATKMRAALSTAQKIRGQREMDLRRLRDRYKREKRQVLDLKAKYQAAVRAIEDACGYDDDDDDTIDRR
jgi:hypothetical protein